MKNILLTSAICFILTLAAYGQSDTPIQCPTGYVCLDQIAANKLNAIVDKYAQAKAVIDAAEGKDKALAEYRTQVDAMMAKVANYMTLDAAATEALGRYIKTVEANEAASQALLAKKDKLIAAKKTAFGRALDGLKLAYYVLSVAFLVK